MSQKSTGSQPEHVARVLERMRDRHDQTHHDQVQHIKEDVLSTAGQRGDTQYIPAPPETRPAESTISGLDTGIKALADVPIIKELRTASTRPGRKAYTAASTIADEPPAPADLTFQMKHLVSVCLPHGEPRGNPEAYTRKSADGRVHMTITPGRRINTDTDESEPIGFPFGTIPRLILLWITEQAVKTGERRLYLGESLPQFLRSLGLNPRHGSGKDSDKERFKKQIYRLFRSKITFDMIGNNRLQWQELTIAQSGEFWLPDGDADNPDYFQSWIELSEPFFQLVTEGPFPVDRRVIAAVKHSSLAIDVYCWLVHRSYACNDKRKHIPVSWRKLQEQFGPQYNDTRNFKKKFLTALSLIKTIYGKNAPFRVVRGGVDLLPGKQLIPSKPLAPLE